jgi:cation diffusion facilitator family transporter
MNISLGMSALMFLLKWSAFVVTGSSAAFSDAAETIAHVAAVAFSSYSLRVAYRPPDNSHQYGHDKITYVASGLEGGLVISTGGVIIYEAVLKILRGGAITNPLEGITLIASAALLNVALGLYLRRTGKRHSSVILSANATHVMSDAWTSAGAIAGIWLATTTGWWLFDPILAMLFAGKIIWDGVDIVRDAVRGLMDTSNPALCAIVEQTLTDFCTAHGLTFHKMRLRQSGAKVYVDFHVQFPPGTPIEAAHALASAVERQVAAAVAMPSDVISHLESQ